MTLTVAVKRVLDFNVKMRVSSGNSGVDEVLKVPPQLALVVAVEA